jgi:CBS domain-containing protein
MSQKLRKIMVERVVTIEPKATIRQAAELMNLHEIGCVLVVDHEKAVGILTERDMLKRIICKSRSPNTTKVIDMMTKPLVTASQEMRAGDAAKMMFERNIKKLPVVENGRLAGLVTLTDLLRSPGVLDFLNKLALDGVSKRLKNKSLAPKNVPSKHEGRLLDGMPKRKVHVVGRKRMRRHQNLTPTPSRRNTRNKRSGTSHRRRLVSRM